MLTFDINVLFNYWDLYMEGFLNTIKVSLIALVASFLLGALIAVFRIAPFKPLNWLGTIYVEIFRNIPLLITVYLFYLGLGPLGINLDGFKSGTIGLSIYTAAYIAEAIRAGIQTVPKGQMEAGRSSGLTYNQTMIHVILPQAIKIALPAMGNQFINLFKNSSILAVVAAADLMLMSDRINSETFLPVSVYAFTALLYLVVTLPLSFVMLYMEKRLAKTS
ncbi:amino acid ABC transporter permease [Paenibacillus sp. P96]|uniref:Amino acid ABC transporter permease n=1 Tax=Paenibacillus zeirhizosphaerae TaxID=2987519 RepID=A0ABT9FN82_9BACL|nr:amino acid ABC transporter permease [Paenibacillus sp. P96]MDP4096050.1 amino acid ABC transporter permease [Paenibacillus sp. P96]